MYRQVDAAPKPYNRCIECTHRKEHACDGPRTSAMPLPRWCEYMRDMKNANGLTNAEVAEEAKVSIKTIERLMSQRCDQDIMRETARLIENAIIGSSNRFPCYLAFEEQHMPSEKQLAEALERLDEIAEDNEEYRAALAGIHDSYNAEMATIRAEHDRKVRHLLDEIAEMQEEIKFLRLENDRKAKVIDKLIG